MRCRALNNNPLSVTEMFQLRRYESVSHQFDKVKTLTAIMHEVTAHKEHGIEAADVAKAFKMNILNIKSAYIWLLKYKFIAAFKRQVPEL